MSTQTIHSVFEKQQRFFNTHVTLEYVFRKNTLNRLEHAINTYENELINALSDDLGKSTFEAYGSEIALVKTELRYIRRNLKKWMRPKKHPDVLINFPSKNYSLAVPYGVSLVIGPWNYPVQLCLNPIIGAIAAGNTVLLKPSEWAPHVAEVLKKMIEEFFDPEYIAVIIGDHTISSTLVNLDLDYIFFTGSTKVGRIIGKSAGSRLIPCTLELGGKSPCIVDKNANLKVSAKRIAWGKYLNAGQTCVAPDYIIVHKDVEEKFIECLKKVITEFYGVSPEHSPDYSRIVSEKHVKRLHKLLKGSNKKTHAINNIEIVIGGDINKRERYISPTVVRGIDMNHPLMQEEIFGPILPILTFEKRDEIAKIIEKNALPLACYLFSNDINFQKYFNTKLKYGGGAINDTIAHLGNPNLPFGGIATSGIGAYHGKSSFETFSHIKSIMKKNYFFDIPLRYPPYTDKLKWLKKFF
ncbi:MAG: aldehyde dehydrogenase [Bacteroidota bacterium]|nr:aldehyde dehydrogenase [Bacteroidota bacterium]